jgi:predicted 3-demethylubiquinone-9 3-methyltransferase (glyoxalase superfamily)
MSHITVERLPLDIFVRERRTPCPQSPPSRRAITPCLWFDTQGEEAANFYVSVFPNSRVLDVTRFNEAGMREAGTVMTVTFELDGQRFVALNGGPHFTFNEAVSFLIQCDTQEQVDHYWNTLTADGGEPGQCGWLKDKYGVSWQVVPNLLVGGLDADEDSQAGERVTEALLQMGKLDIETLERAARAS